MAKNKTINVQGIDIVLYQENNNDYISLTDIARHKDSEHTDTIIQKLDEKPKYHRTFMILGNNL